MVMRWEEEVRDVMALVFFGNAVGILSEGLGTVAL